MRCILYYFYWCIVYLHYIENRAFSWSNALFSYYTTEKHLPQRKQGNPLGECPISVRDDDTAPKATPFPNDPTSHNKYPNSHNTTQHPKYQSTCALYIVLILLLFFLLLFLGHKKRQKRTMGRPQPYAGSAEVTLAGRGEGKVANK